MGAGPRSPANRRPQRTAASTVDPTRVSHARCLQLKRQRERQLGRRDSSRYQPRPSMAMVRAKNGHVSTRNAGAKASPAEVPPNKPSRPGMTHHQGNGSRPLNTATKGFSICNSLSILAHLRFVATDYKPSGYKQSGQTESQYWYNTAWNGRLEDSSCQMLHYAQR